MYKFDVSENLEKILNRLSKKDKDLYNQILKKIDEVIIVSRNSQGGTCKAYRIGERVIESHEIIGVWYNE